MSGDGGDVLERVTPLLRSYERSDVEQAMELLVLADRMGPIAQALTGTRIAPNGSLQPGPWLTRYVDREHRRWLALSLLGAAGRLDHIRRLSLGHPRDAADLAPLERMAQLERLSLHGRRALSVADLPDLPSLLSLDLSVSGQAEWPASPPDLPLLERLNLRDCPRLEVLRIDGGLPSLSALDLTRCEALHTVELVGLPSLQTLVLRSCQRLGELTLKELPELEIVDAAGCTALEVIDSDAEPLEVDLRGCGRLERAPDGWG